MAVVVASLIVVVDIGFVSGIDAVCTGSCFGDYLEDDCGICDDDPTNDDIKFNRIKVRNLIKKFKNFGLDKKKFQLTIENLKKSDQSIKFYVEKNKRVNSIFNYKKNP